MKLAWKTGWIESEDAWLAMLEDRNRTAHTYDEDLARDVFRRLPAHLDELRRAAARVSGSG